MTCSSGASSSGGFSMIMLHNSASEEDLQMIMDQRKRRRMLSNRESARRSRMRKQKHLDELMALVGHFRKENGQLIKSFNITTQLYLNIEADNSILRAQLAELSQRLESLNEINSFVNFSTQTEPETVDDWDSDSVFVNDHHPSFLASTAQVFPVM